MELESLPTEGCGYDHFPMLPLMWRIRESEGSGKSGLYQDTDAFALCFGADHRGAVYPALLFPSATGVCVGRESGAEYSTAAGRTSGGRYEICIWTWKMA